MLALYRCGRQATRSHAIDCPRVLVDELGIEPGAALQELERAILSTTRRSTLQASDGRTRSALAAHDPRRRARLSRRSIA